MGLAGSNLLPGHIGLLTGPAGVGKTAALRQITTQLNPYRFVVLYSVDTDFSRSTGIAISLWHSDSNPPPGARNSMARYQITYPRSRREKTLLAGLDPRPSAKSPDRVLPRHAGIILQNAMKLAVPKGLNHLPDELIQDAIEALQ